METKTRRKKEGGDRALSTVVSRGHALQFGNGVPDSRSLEQARQQASRLSAWLSKATGDAVEVRPVLALPGWWVQRSGFDGVIVVNGKEVGTLAKGEVVLDEGKIKRIVHQLDQRCRDVEF